MPEQNCHEKIHDNYSVTEVYKPYFNFCTQQSALLTLLDIVLIHIFPNNILNLQVLLRHFNTQAITSYLFMKCMNMHVDSNIKIPTSLMVFTYITRNWTGLTLPLRNKRW